MRLIDADALIEEFGDINMDIYTDEVKEYIDSAPTIEPKRGEWKFVGSSIEMIWECPFCGEHTFGFEEHLPNYCSNCGARMKGADDERPNQERRCNRSDEAKV